VLEKQDTLQTGLIKTAKRPGAHYHPGIIIAGFIRGTISLK